MLDLIYQPNKPAPYPRDFVAAIPLLREIADVVAQKESYFCRIPGEPRVAWDQGYSNLIDRVLWLCTNLSKIVARWPRAEAEALTICINNPTTLRFCIAALKRRNDGSAHEAMDTWAAFEAFMSKHGPLITWASRSLLAERLAATIGHE